MLKENFRNLLIENQEKKLNISDIHVSLDNGIWHRKHGIIEIIEKSLTKDDLNKIYDVTTEHLSDRAKKNIEDEIQEKGHSAYTVEIKNFRYRVNVSKLKGSKYLVLREIPEKPKSLEELNFSVETTTILKSIAKKEKGLFCVVGQTGSGKSTTLNAIIKYLNDNFQKNIITLEDPVECIQPKGKSHIIQKELKRDFPSFQEGLKGVLREDPNVISVAEIRDSETLKLALDAAETGHLVFATLHTDDSVGTIQRLISLSDNPTLTRDRLQSSLLGSLAQRLIIVKKETSYERHLVWELLTVNKAISALIKEEKDTQISGALDNTVNCQSFDKTLAHLVSAKRISQKEAELHAIDRQKFILLSS